MATGGSCVVAAPATSITCQVPPGNWSFSVTASDAAGASDPDNVGTQTVCSQPSANVSAQTTSMAPFLQGVQSR